MEEHRANPACAGCHKMMDPIGFSLENFDAVGVWRTNDSGFRIDASGQMFDGAKLDGPASLRQAHPEPLRCVHLAPSPRTCWPMAWAACIDIADMPVVRAIDRAAART